MVHILQKPRVPDLTRLRAKKRSLHDGTLASGAPADGRTPLIELSVPETLAVRRWLEMAERDMVDQVGAAAKANLTKADFEATKRTASIIGAYLGHAKATCDAQLASVMQPSAPGQASDDEPGAPPNAPTTETRQ